MLVAEMKISDPDDQRKINLGGSDSLKWRAGERAYAQCTGLNLGISVQLVKLICWSMFDHYIGKY